jgi:hypothetical protein
MKRQIIISIALATSFILLSLTSSDSTVKAENRIRVIADTGVVTLGANQFLRISLIFDDTEGAESVSFRRLVYAPGACSGGICKLAAVSQTTSPVITAQPGEAILFDLIDPQGQVKVISNARRARVGIAIIDSLTGKVVSYQNEYAGGASGDLIR